MEILDPQRSIVVVIDLQGKLVEMAHRWGLVIAGTLRLLRLAELFRVPVILTEQYPRGLGRSHPEVQKAFDELTVPTGFLEKTSFGCCGDPGFESLLERARPDVLPGQRQIVVAGIEAHVCVMATVLELLKSGSQVHVCWECVSGRGAEYRQHALNRMSQAGAVLTNHESVAFEWCRDKNDPRFKEMSALLKEGQLVE